MMNELPYIRPDTELNINIAILTLILNELAITKRQKKVLTVEKLQTFYFLVTKPVFLNGVLNVAGKKLIEVDESDYFTVDTMSVNLEELYDKEKVRLLLQLIASRGWLLTSFTAKEGFVFSLSCEGKERALEFTGDYLSKIKRNILKLKALQSETPSKLSTYINQVNTWAG